MNFPHKCHHPRNFAFVKRHRNNQFSVGGSRFELRVDGCGDGVYHVAILNDRVWPSDYRCREFSDSPRRGGSDAGSLLEIGSDLSLCLRDRSGDVVLETMPGEGFGVSGEAWLFQFVQTRPMQFFGMGEKSTPFEKSRRTHRFWNTDAWADFGARLVRDAYYDPDYISVPYVIIKQGNVYAGLLIDNPHASYISISPKMIVSNQLKAAEMDRPFFFLGAEKGAPSLYVLYGPSLEELTRKLQRLVGTVPAPPLWALGYHQCRWGYRGTKDLTELADKFEAHQIPADGLWLDIDYMDGYRVFTFSKEHFKNPVRELQGLRRRGYRIVPILDPGVKHERGNDVYESGRKLDLFCKNAAGNDFVGLVWPGYTVFPDFSLKPARSWWASKVEEFVKNGIDGVWLDMNDPSTGSIDCNCMLFRRGKAPHHAFHNQYADLMAMATREGFLKARPGVRPFLISRSGSTGSQKYCGHWQGDNYSNYHHLAMAIGKTVNMSLSGMPMCAPDVGGFGGDATEPLLVDWMKACFLFPLLRNHSCRGTRRQEPWAFTARAMRILRTYIRMRYKLLPYLYNLFVAQERHGDPVIRPLFYHFADSRKLPLTIDDQFMVGPSIMQAPFVTSDEQRRVVLPGGPWYRIDTAKWIEGRRELRVSRDPQTTPVFIRDGAIVALQRGECKDNRKDLRSIELLVALSRNYSGWAEVEYVCDDGETFGYRRGERSSYRFRAKRDGGDLVVEVTPQATGFGEVKYWPLTLELFDTVIVKTGSICRKLKPRARKQILFGSEIPTYQWG